MTLEKPLLIASDVDETLLAYHESLEGELLELVCQLLTLESIRLTIVTGNDYVKLQRARVVEPIPPVLRRNLVVYGDGCTRKLTFTEAGDEVEDENYRAQVEFDPHDREIVRGLLDQHVEAWLQHCPDLCRPEVEIGVSNMAILVSVGPINVNEPDTEAWRDDFQEAVIGALEEKFDHVYLRPSDRVWVKLQCRPRNRRPEKARETIEDIIRGLLQTSRFSCLARPTIVNRDRQLAIRPIRPMTVSGPMDIRDALIEEIAPHLSGEKRQTKREYGVLVGGRTTIDIQRKGVDKAFGMRDLMNSLSHRGEVLYFGDAFYRGGNDRPVATVEGVQCLSVGPLEDLPPGVVGIGEGPPTIRACLQSILWALTGHTRTDLVGRKP